MNKEENINEKSNIEDVEKNVELINEEVTIEEKQVENVEEKNRNDIEQLDVKEEVQNNEQSKEQNKETNSVEKVEDKKESKIVPKKEKKLQRKAIIKDNKKQEEYDDIDEKDLLTPTEKKKKRNKLIVILSLIVIFFLLIFFCGIVCVNKMNTNVYKNVYILGINMSGKTKDEVFEILEYIAKKEKNIQAYGTNVDSIKNKINTLDLKLYQDNENIYNIAASDINFNIDVEKTTKDIIGFGRNKNIILNNYEILKAFFSQKEIEPIYKYDNEKLEEICKNVELTIKNRLVDDKYSIDTQNNKLVITRGTTGNTINIEMEKENVIENFSYQVEEYMSQNISNILHLSIIEKKPNNIDIDKVYSEIKKEPKDAYIDKESNPIKLVKEEVGYDLNIESTKKILETKENKQEGKVIEIELIVIEPKVKLEDIAYTLYLDKLAGYTTYFDPYQYARANNLRIALEYLNGKIIMPGETFSYNDAIGDTTVAKGYMAAATFKGGTVVQELGGGICQTTSTLYNVALMANLEIVERHQHGLPVGYVPPSRDATVYSPNLDFKFKNTRKYPVKIVTSYSNSGSLNISIFGTREETEYEVILSHRYISTIPFNTVYQYDNTMYEGEQIVVSAGVNGYTSESYITKKLNGTVTYSAILSQDKYNPQQQIVRVGTKKQVVIQPEPPIQNQEETQPEPQVQNEENS